MLTFKATLVGNRSVRSLLTRNLIQTLLTNNCTISATLDKRMSFEEDKRMSFEEDKQKFLAMTLEEKLYYYKGTVTTVAQLSTWAEYWTKNKLNIPKTLEKLDEKVDEELANKISIWQGDITTLEVDAIVNAANSSLLGGGGVDGCIHKGAGISLTIECASLEGCKVGQAKITGGYMLPTKYIIHTVGPYNEKPEKLKECYENSLALAKENNLTTIAFPCISTGIYGYPQKPAARVAISTVKKFLQENKDNVKRIIFCVFLNRDKEIYEDLLQKYFNFE